MIFFTFAVGVGLIIWIFRLNKDYHVLGFFAPRIKTADGTKVENLVPTVPGKTIFGNTFDTFGLDPVSIFQDMRHTAAKMKGRSYVEYIMGNTLVNVIDAELAEMVFTDTKLITKGFIDHLNGIDADVVLLNQIIPKFTLDVVCETALGVKLDECLNGDEYRNSFGVFEESFNKRSINPLLMIERIYKVFEEHKYVPALKIVHDFSSDIIKKRRELFADKLNKTEDNEEFLFGKKRYAMLDTLLRAEKEGLIDHAGICEEVDTFMFEGYDTTSMGLIFSLMNLSLHLDMQDRCYQEIMDNIKDINKLDIAQLNLLKYMECFMKETLRLYPSVPAIMREAVQETQLANGLILPAHSFIAVHLFDLQRNPRHFENPNVFDPERFTPEKSKGRHPYAFSPFSAGQRNCIGQRFAMLEMKTLLIYVIKNFKILPLVEPSDFEFKFGIIIRANNDVKVKLVKR